jgi:hypothetical protein
MKILADFHHECLFRSLQRLGDRLGAEVLRPKGLEWFNQNLWHINDNPPTANQFLGDETYKDLPGVTLEEARETDWACVIVSHFANLQPWQREFQGKPVVLQAGNNWSYHLPCFKDVQFVLNSTSTQWPQAKKHVRYHPEFEIREPKNGKKPNSVYSLCHYPVPEAQELFSKLSKELPGWTFSMFGAGTEHGPLRSYEELMDVTSTYSFLFQFKPGGDGYGFNIHRAWAHNTPVIMDYNHYADKMAAMCMVDRISSFDLSNGIQTVASQLKGHLNTHNERTLSLSSKYIWMCNCDPFDEWQTRLKPFFEAVL